MLLCFEEWKIIQGSKFAVSEFCFEGWMMDGEDNHHQIHKRQRKPEENKGILSIKARLVCQYIQNEVNKKRRNFRRT